MPVPLFKQIGHRVARRPLQSRTCQAGLKTRIPLRAGLCEYVLVHGDKETCYPTAAARVVEA